MAFTNLYIQTTGADANAGTSTADAADVTQTNGSWDITADTFIATAATPFSGVTTNDYASIYVDGGTVAVYVAKVVSINAGGLSITLSTTVKYGTKPSASATGRSCKINGAWASEQPLAAGGLATTTVPQSTKVNIKAGTYTVTANRTISMAGATTTPLWFSGYNTAPGDLDNDITNGSAKPVWAFNATFNLTMSGAHQIWSGLSITGAISTLLVSPTGLGMQWSRVRVENTSANAAATTLYLGTNGVFAYCWFKTPTTATTFGTINGNTGSAIFIGCVAEGGGLAGFNLVANTALTYEHCIALNNTGSGWLHSTGSSRILHCTVYNATADGVKWSGTPSALCCVVGCLFETCGGIGINNGSGANTNLVFRACNDFHGCTGGNEAGFGDSPAFFGQTDSSTVVTSSTDMTPVSGSNARGKGFPQVFEGGGALGSQANPGQNIGAVHEAAAGGSSSINRAALPSGLSALG